MKAIIYRKYGCPDVLELADIEKPVPKDDEVLIKVHATTVSPVDWHFRSGTPFLARKMAGGFLKPKIVILGFDIAGEIESAGRNVQRLKGGDQVYGLVPLGANGANAEYICRSFDVNLFFYQRPSFPYDFPKSDFLLIKMPF